MDPPGHPPSAVSYNDSFHAFSTNLCGHHADIFSTTFTNWPLRFSSCLPNPCPLSHPLPAAGEHSSRLQTCFPLFPLPAARKIKPKLLSVIPSHWGLAPLLSLVPSPASLLEAPTFLSAFSSPCFLFHHLPGHLNAFYVSIRAQNMTPPLQEALADL